MTDRRPPPGLDGVLPLLACPHCSAGLRRDGGVVGCGSGHRFDLARQGYLSLLGTAARTDTGDTAEMVAARAAFLGEGHYRPIAEAVADRVGGGPVLEIGAGTGYYLGAAIDRLAAAVGPDAVGLALDSSRYAARRAASAHARIGSIVADAWSRLPIRDGAIGSVLSVFAPRDPAEIARVLAPGWSGDRGHPGTGSPHRDQCGARPAHDRRRQARTAGRVVRRAAPAGRA